MELKSGARWMFPVPVPVPGDVVVTVMKIGPEAFVNVSGFPSGSVANNDWSAVVPSSTVMFAGCASDGGRPGEHTVIVKDLLSLPGQAPPTVAVTDAANVPDVADEGARWIFPVRVAPA